MTERQRRGRVHDQRPPSRLMRSLLRLAFFAVDGMIHRLGDAERLSPRTVADLRRAFELSRCAAAREPYPAHLAALGRSVPPSPADAIAALKLVRLHLRAIDISWKGRLTAAGIDSKWPGDDA